MQNSKRGDSEIMYRFSGPCKQQTYMLLFSSTSILFFLFFAVVVVDFVVDNDAAPAVYTGNYSNSSDNLLKLTLNTNEIPSSYQYLR